MEMTTKLTIRIVGTLPQNAKAIAKLPRVLKTDKKGQILYEVTRAQFHPAILDDELKLAIEVSEKQLKALGVNSLSEVAPELSIQLSSRDGQVRPALHLTKQVIESLSRMGASLDFDPYC